MLAVETIEFCHGNQASHQPALLQNVNFVVQEPRIVVLLDLSGAGKSTLICCLNGALVPQRGRILFGLSGSAKCPCVNTRQRSLGPLPTGGTANQFRCDLSGTPW